jgi:site-specific DNA-methyltransferase (adenine-specific)
VLKLMQKAADFKSRCKADLFIDAWRGTGFRIVGHLVLRKRYPSSTRFLRYQQSAARLCSASG